MKIEINQGVETPVTKFFCYSPETDAFFLKKGSWNEEILNFCRKMERERDEAKAERDILRIDAQREAEHHDRMVNELQRLYNKLDKTRDIFKSVVDKANELIARWDAPSWKDTAPTARFINALRFAVRAYERNLK
jgi:HrpA-like RNA helicase